MEQKKCNKCGIVKPYCDFHNRKASSDGYDLHCKECRRGYVPSPKLEDYKDNTHNYERIGRHTEEILTALGYELYNEDYPVHKQFEERMATKYKNR